MLGTFAIYYPEPKKPSDSDLELIEVAANVAIIAIESDRSRAALEKAFRDTKKYGATGGWGFAHFNDGKPAEEAVLKTCFPCHAAIKDRDLVFTRYSP